ncbi:MAG: polysaccharide biosynthesis tyrosine autokinase [Acidobacteriota bacterium]
MEDNQERFEEKEINLFDYWNIIYKHRYVVLITLLVLVTTITLWTFMIPPTYKATAQVQIERDIPNVLPFKEVLSMAPSYDDFYQTQYKLIQSRTIARKVIDELDLQENEQFTGKKGFSLMGFLKGLFSSGKDNDADDEPDDSGIVNAFLGGLMVEPIRNSRLVNISYISHSPELAARIANTVAEKYIAFNTESKYRTTTMASDSLEKEIHSLRTEIASLESTMQQFAREHNLYVFEGENQNLMQKSMSQIMQKASEATIQRIERENIYKSIQSSPADALPEIMNSRLIQDLKADISRLEQEYQEKSKKFKEEWPQMAQLREKISAAKDLMEQERTHVYKSALSAAKREYLEALQVEESLKKELDELSKDTQNLLADHIKYSTMSADLQTKKKNLEDLLKRSGETGISASLESSMIGNIWIVDRAETPHSIYKPKKRSNIALSLIVGLLLGIGLAFFFEYLDNTLKTIEDVEKYVKISVLGIIPKEASSVQQKTQEAESRLDKEIDLVCFHEPKSKTAEAFKELRTSILLSSPDSPPKTYLITSNQPKEGKTFVSLNLAVTFTQIGKRILLIDTDLRKPRIHKILGLKNTMGISNYLSGNAAFNEIFQDSPIPNLSIITSGPIPPNPSELIDSKNFSSLLDYLKGHDEFDHIIFDSPPVLSVTDPTILSSKVDAVILVIHGAKTPRDAAIRGKEKLSLVNAKIIGCTINNVDIYQSSYPYYKYYYYHYYHDEDSEQKVLEMKKKNRKVFKT